MVRTLLALAVLAFAPALAAAAGTVQLTLSGQVHVDGGTPVVLEVDAGGRAMVWRGTLARETWATDVAALLARRLKAEGIGHTLGSDAAPRGPVSLFIEDVERVRVRLGDGLAASLTTSDEAPRSLRVLPPRLADVSRGGTVEVHVTCSSSDGERLLRRRLSLDLPDAPISSSRVADQLASKASQAGLSSSRPSGDAWAATGALTGEAAVAMSVVTYADADWGIELLLAPRIDRR